MTILNFVAAVLLVLSVTIFGLRYSRAGYYRSLETLQESHRSQTTQRGRQLAEQPALPGFDQCLVSLENALEPENFERIQQEISSLVETERSYLPSHKKGGTVAYETLLQKAPATIQLYLSEDLASIISKIVGETVRPTPLNDQSSCSVLFYERPGDHIGWHYDHNFYKGRHLTVLLAIINHGQAETGLSAARLEANIEGSVRSLPTPPNTLVVFEGQKVLHRVTPIEMGERRVILSMTFATDTSANLLQGIKRRIKDTAFFGLRALWT